MPRLQTPLIPTDACLLVEIPQKSLSHFTFCPCRGLDHCGSPRGLCCSHLNRRTLHYSSRQELLLEETAIAIPTPSIFIVLVDITDLVQLCL